MPQQPDLILLGYGVDDALQLTVQTQRILSQAGKVYAVSLPPGLARFLKSQRVQVEDLTDRFRPGRPFADCYLDVADHLFRRAAVEQPVCFLSPGNPLFLNSLNRFIVMQAGQRGLSVQTYPGVSQVDAIISDIGLDVATFGLQLFDARRLVARRQAINPAVPLVILQLAGFSADSVGAELPDYAPLGEYLAGFYPAGHLVTLLNREPGSPPARATLPLSRLNELVQHVGPSSSLFMDGLRQPQAPPPASTPK
ncbi:MAG TPA: SAM-dependent methyltransferase [Dehalococcoidia bacterium]|jgi:precorrin-6B methylase 1